MVDSRGARRASLVVHILTDEVSMLLLWKDEKAPHLYRLTPVLHLLPSFSLN